MDMPSLQQPEFQTWALKWHCEASSIAFRNTSMLIEKHLKCVHGSAADPWFTKRISAVQNFHNCSKQISLPKYSSSDSNHSLIHSYHFYSASSSPQLLKSAADTERILCRSVTQGPQATAS